MQRIFHILLAFLMALALLVWPMPARAALPPNPSPVCPSGQVFLGSQAWWSDARVPFPGQHIHADTCFPLGATINGTLTLNVVGQLHGDPGAVNLLRVQVWGNSRVEKHTDIKISPAWRCTADCTRNFTISIDTNSIPAGRKEIRLTFNIPTTPIGNRHFNTSRWPICVRSCTGPGAPNIDRSGAAGWYNKSKYANVAMRDAMASRLAFGGPISGQFAIPVRGDKPTFVVAVDARAHNADPGLILYSGAGNNTWRSVVIDTTQLADGQHKLFLRTDHSITGPTGINSGVFTMPFTVDNP